MLNPARRAAGPAPGPPRRNRFLPLVVTAVAAAVLAGVLTWALLPRGPGAAPSPVAAAATAPVPAASAPAPTEDEKGDAERLLASCRLKAAAGDRVLAEARTVLAGWSEHLRATTDFDAGSTTLDQRAATWRRTATDAEGALRRHGSAVDEYARAGDCQWLAGAPAEYAARLDACTMRLTMLRRAIDASERPVSDWRRHLRDEAARAADPRTVGDWERSWVGSRYTLDEWNDADRKYAGAPACS